MSATGDLWRTLEEAAGEDPGTRAAAEFPAYAAGLDGRIDRRDAVGLAGAGMVMAGLVACKPEEALVPWVRQPEMTVPGIPRHYPRCPLTGTASA